MNRVVLIHPPAISKRYLRTRFMPYGMGVLYAYLKAHNVPVVQYDFLMEYLFDAPDDINYNDSEKSFSQENFFSFINDGREAHKGIQDFVEKYGSRIPTDGIIYAFSIVAYHQFWASLLLGQYIKQANPDAVIVFGGPFITIKPAEAFAGYGQADYWIKGSGETPILMLYHILLNRQKENAIRQIPGIIFFSHSGVFSNPQSVLNAQDELPPDFEGLNIEKYRYDHPITGPDTLFVPYRTSKGCPTGCSFCTGRLVDHYSTKQVNKIIGDLAFLSNSYNTEAFMFTDASINGDYRLISEICKGFAQSLPSMKWYAYAKVEGCTSKLLEQMCQAGCFSLFWGIESANPSTIHLLGKKFRVEKMSEIIDKSIEFGIRNYIHLMYNTPHETMEDVRLFIRFVERYINSEEVIFITHRFLLEPQSIMYEHPHRYGLSGIKKLETSIFEREQYLFKEAGWISHEQIRKRNEKHLKILEPCLELINLKNAGYNGLREQM
jgi:anaerobic magnesium-protoporphyrin IX monomethyl ester cyclase